MSPSRRECIAIPARALGGALLCTLAGEVERLPAQERQDGTVELELRHFTAAQARTVQAVCERIFPSDGSGPGEVELEQAWLEYDFTSRLSGRAGVFLLPVGILNETHEPPTFYGVERNNVEVVVPRQRCCGMPRMDIADFGGCRDAMTANVMSLAPYVDDGYTVVTPGPSCSLMFRDEYPKLAEGKANEAEVQKVSAATQDLCEFLVALHKAGNLDTGFKHPQGAIGYHQPCHLKSQNIGMKSRDLLKLIPETTVEVTDRCSGHDGTWAMKTENFDTAMKVAGKLVRGMEKGEPEQFASDCALASLNIRQKSGRTVLHPIQIVARAYGIETA